MKCTGCNVSGTDYGWAGGVHIKKPIEKGWMVKNGKRKIGLSYIHMMYFVSEPLLLAWDCSFQHGSLVEEVDGQTAVFSVNI
ncbi:hypothetical protein YC2023_042802 [Brassica napus]